MKYIVRTKETELYNCEYIVEAESEDKAKKKILGTDWADVEIIDPDIGPDYDIEVIEIEPYNEIFSKNQSS